MNMDVVDMDMVDMDMVDMDMLDMDMVDMDICIWLEKSSHEPFQNPWSCSFI